VYHGSDSGTQKVTFKKVKWRNSVEEFLLVDSPGFSDSKKDDYEIADKMIIYLSEIKYVNMILIVLNSKQTRICGNI
jgi:predicted GTPase